MVFADESAPTGDVCDLTDLGWMVFGFVGADLSAKAMLRGGSGVFVKANRLLRLDCALSGVFGLNGLRRRVCSYGWGAVGLLWGYGC